MSRVRTVLKRKYAPQSDVTMDEFVIQTPARLHFGLLDLNGGLGRIDGGIGLALEQPRTVISARRSDKIEAYCPMERAIEERLNEAVRKVSARFMSCPARRLKSRNGPSPIPASAALRKRW